MPSIADQLAGFRSHPVRAEGAGTNPLSLESTLSGPASADEIARAWPDRTLPQAVIDLWTTARDARLFADVNYGQWGLALLSPAASAARTAKERSARPRQFGPDDMVLGEFLGDQELLVVSTAEDDARVMIALPLDDRPDWYTAAGDLGGFLAAYWRSGGDKFWE